MDYHSAVIFGPEGVAVEAMRDLCELVLLECHQYCIDGRNEEMNPMRACMWNKRASLILSAIETKRALASV